MRRFNIEYKTLKNNIENNVIPYLDKIDTQEIMYHIVTTNLIQFKNDNDNLFNVILVAFGSIIIGLSNSILTLPIWGLLGPTAVGIGIVNCFCARSISAKLDTISSFLSMYLMNERGLSESSFLSELKNIDIDEYDEWLNHSIYIINN
jgi:hypothetical protein